MNRFQRLIRPETEQQKQQQQLLILLLIAGIGWYFFSYLDRKRTETKSEIRKLFQANSSITTADLDASLWKYKENWEEYVDSLYLGSSIKQFSKKIEEAIKERAEMNNDEKNRKSQAIKELKDSCSSEEKNWPTMKKIIEDYSKKIKKARVNDISTLQKEASDLIVEERVKKQGLHWKRKIKEAEKSWIDKELLKFKDAFEEAWTEKKKRGMNRLNINASYTICFPPSLWNNLTEEQKRHEKATELTLRSEVKNYKFNEQIIEWYDKAVTNPVRGEKDPQSQKDNNALFYGTGGTGKSITAEKLAYEADVYPLVVVKGSALTPKLPDQQCSIPVLEKFLYTIADINWTLIDDFGFKRNEGGEVRYILFIDEADQISENSFSRDSNGLIFLKEIMGSDNYKVNESWNLWIAATNHLEKIDRAVYRSGRLSNPLCFSWTLGDFMKYADKEGISRQFPSYWLKETVLSSEDNKWVNRFNVDYFNDKFLLFWDRFIEKNPNAEYEPEGNGQSNRQNQKKIKIKWGEMFEFFWNLFDSKQLESFEGKFTNPRQPKIEEVLGTRLKELSESVEDFKRAVKSAETESISILEKKLTEIKESMK